MNRFATRITVASLCCCLVSGFVPAGNSQPRCRHRSSITRMIETDQDEFTSAMITKEGVMGGLPELIHEPKEGENEYGGGQKFKQFMETAKREGAATAEAWAKEQQGGTAATAAAAATPQRQQQQALPPGWESAVDPTSGQMYYYSRATGETSWDPPAMNAQQQTEAEAPPPENEGGSQQDEAVAIGELAVEEEDTKNTEELEPAKGDEADDDVVVFQKEDTVDSLRNELKFSKLFLEEVKEQLEEARTELDKARTEIASMEKSSVVVAKDDDEAEKDGDNDGVAGFQREDTVDSLRNDLKFSKLFLEEVQEQLEEARTEIASMKRSVSRMEEEASSRQQEISRLRSMVASSSSDGVVPTTKEEEAPEESTANNDEEIIAKDEAVPQQQQSSRGDDWAQKAAQSSLRAAVVQMDATTVSSMLESGMVEMDEATVEAAFWSVVKEVDRAEKDDEPLSEDVAVMLHRIFEADLKLLLKRDKITTNVTCMQPAESGLTTNAMNYIFDDSSHKDLELKEGRRCEDGSCCDACSRNIFPTFATEAESDIETFPELTSLTFNELETVSTATIIHFTRLIERVRRTIAHEYGLPLKTILPLQAYSRKYVAGSTQQGGGGGEGDFVTLHTDEATHTGYHYSCVIYLSTQGVDFEGGDFVFNDPKPKDEKDGDDNDDDDEDDEEERLAKMPMAEQIRRAGRKFTPFHPTRGAAVVFSSGWENMHEVDKITAGTRYAVPCFFTTCPVPDAAYDHMVQGKPKNNEDIADDWLHLLLAHRKESPQQSLGRVKELLMKWHYMCTPLSEH